MKTGWDLNEMVVFARVAGAASFTRAAQELEMPKSTVSRKISELEARLGARLLQRTTRKLSLTDVGRIYYPHCLRVIAEIEEAERAVGRLQETPRGLLRLTVPLNFGFFGPILADFLQRYPEVQVGVVCTDRVVDLIEEGFDLAIRAGPLLDSTLIARHLGTSRRVVVASPSYLDRRGRPQSPDELARHDCLLFGAGQDRAAWRLQLDGKAVEAALSPRLVVNDFDLLREATIAGLGVAMIPADQCLADLQARRLERILGAWCSPEAPIHAVYPSTRHLSPKVKVLLDHLLSDRGLQSHLP